MSGYSQNSRAAFHAIDRESGLQTLIRYFKTQPSGFALTRFDLHLATGLPEKTVCGRVHDGLNKEPQVFEECGEKDGRALVRLKSATPLRVAGPRVGSFTATEAQGMGPLNAEAQYGVTDRRDDQLTSKNTTPPSPSNESADVFNRLVAVVTESAAGQVGRVLATTAHRSSASAAPHNYFSTTGDLDGTGLRRDFGDDGGLRGCSAMSGDGAIEQNERDIGVAGKAGRGNDKAFVASSARRTSSNGAEQSRRNIESGTAGRPVAHIEREIGDRCGEYRARDISPRNLVAVVPCIGYVKQISIETAKRILKEDPKNAFYDAAVARVKGLKSV